MATEATAALSDAYGHVMHGDDAGSSARLVWVCHPTRVTVDLDPLAVAKAKAMNGEGSPGRQGGFRYTQKFGELLRG
jgi:hypothetical protein